MPRALHDNSTTIMRASIMRASIRGLHGTRACSSLVVGTIRDSGGFGLRYSRPGPASPWTGHSCPALGRHPYAAMRPCGSGRQMYPGTQPTYVRGALATFRSSRPAGDGGVCRTKTYPSLQEAPAGGRTVGRILRSLGWSQAGRELPRPHGQSSPRCLIPPIRIEPRVRRHSGQIGIERRPWS